jgi:hypothetical protein
LEVKMAGSSGGTRTGKARVVVSGLVVLGSVLGAWLVIESSKATESYLVTKQDLASGSKLLEASLSTDELALFALGANYLKEGELPQNSYLSRSVSAGEAIPRSAVTTQLLDDWSNLVITPSVELSRAIGPGSKVLVWAAPALDYQSFGEPSIAAIDVEVVEIRAPQGNFAQDQESVELRVPVDALHSLLRSISNGDAIALTASSQTLAD